MTQKQALGKGLASLFPGSFSAIQAPENVMARQGVSPAENVMTAGVGNHDRHPGISLALTDEIRTNPFQPRRDFDDQALQELAQSIRSNGIIQPIVVRKGPHGEYQLIAGERRLRAAKLAGLKQVPVVIRKSTDREALELALVENIQRENLNCVDEALAYFQLMEEFSLTQEETAQRVGKDRATVANFLRLLKLPEEVIQDLKAGTLSHGHGKALLALDDYEQRMRVRAKVIEKKLSVRETEALVQEIKSGPETPGTEATAKPLTHVQSRFRALAQELARHWATRVEFRGTEKKGKILIHYSSRQELDRILEAMQN